MYFPEIEIIFHVHDILIIVLLNTYRMIVILINRVAALITRGLATEHCPISLQIIRFEGSTL